MLGHFFDKDGSEEITLRYFGPGRSMPMQATTVLDRGKTYVEGQKVWFHKRWGTFQEYTVVCFDDHDVYFQRTGASWHDSSLNSPPWKKEKGG